MRILIATGLYAPDIGGPATHTAILEKEFPAQGIEVRVYPFSAVRGYPKIIRHALYCGGLLMRSRGVSVIYALDPVSVGLPAYLVSRIARKPLVLRVAGDYAWEQAVGRYGVSMFLDQFVTSRATQPWGVRLLAAIERWVAEHATRIVVPSMYLRKIVTQWGIAEEKITVVYNAFHHDTPLGSREALRQKYGYEGVVVASAGRLVPWKGFRTVIDLIVRLNEEGMPATALIAGDGPEHASLVAYAAERGVSTRVRFLGRCSRQELLETIASADVFVLNTAYEGFSHQLLEVMACGVPVVTTAVGGNGELIVHEKSGFLVPFDDAHALHDAVVRLIRNGEVRTSIIQAAKTQADSFSLPRMVEGIAQVLRQVT